MSMYGSQKALNMGRRNGSKGDLSGMQHYARSEVVHMGGGNGYEPYLDGYNTCNFSKSSGGGMMSAGSTGGMGGGGMMRQMSSGMGGGGTMTRMSSGMGGGGTMTRMSSGGGGGGMGEMSSGMMREVSSGMGGGMMTSVDGGMMSGMGGGMSGSSTIHQRAMILQAQCQEYLKKAEYALQSGGASGDAERYMSMAKETIEQLKGYAMDLRQMGQPNDNVVRTLEICKDQLKGVHMVMTGSLNRRRSTRGSSGGWEEPPRSFQDAMGWIAQQKRLIETASWGDDPAAIEQQLINHSNFHSSIQRSVEVERARDELMKKGDKGNLHALDQEWDSLQQMSFGRTEQLQNLKQIIQDMSKEIMWVNDREEEELMFDWGDKNIDQYIPRKQESYSKLMSALEEKEKDLNKLKARVDGLLKLNHPASDKIEAYRDTLQTQWSWLLQITKCIDVHLKENAAYNQFFKEANETYSGLQKEHETVRMKFACDKNTSLEDLMEFLQGLEREKEKIMENKRQVHHLVNKSRTIVRLKPRNPEEKSSTPVIVKALCDYKQDQKVICKENEAILRGNSQRSKWDVTGPGGLDMLVPSVCLIVPPPNPLGISLANKNEQYYEAILSIWSQLYINVKSLIAWQYCLIDIRKINSLTVTMLSRMRPEEYRQLIKSLETRYEEFKMTSHGSQMFADEDKKMIENQFTGAQTHYDQIVVELPTYIAQQEHIEVQQASGQQHQQQLILVQQAPNQQYQQQLILLQQQQQQQAAAEAEARRLEEEARWREEEARRLEEETRRREEETRRREAEAMRLEEETRRREEETRRREAEAMRLEEETRRLEEERRRAELKRAKKTEVKLVKKVKVVHSSAAPPLSSSSFSSSSTSSSSSSRSLTELHALRLRLEASEGTLSQHVHICLGDDWMHDCGLKISELEMLLRNVDSMREEHLRLREHILKELEGMNDSDKAQFLRNEVEVINQRLGSLESSSSAYLDRLKALRDMLESVEQAEDIVKVHEARLAEKETTSLSPSEVEEYMLTLKNVKAELDMKRGILATMETELAKANHWSGQLGGPFQRCDMMLSKYSEQVVLLSDRWRRLLGQIDTRVQDLQSYQPQLEHYKQTSTSLIDWIDATRTKQDTLQATKIESIQTLMDQINNQKALNSEIKSRRETVESVLRDNEACVISIKDYETDLASYTSGLETLLNIPIKRTMLKSPSMDLNLEATQLQTRYMELLTHSGDYYKFLGELLKNMEELKIRNTRIDLLEEELRLLREGMRDCDSKNKSLEESVSRYELELSDSRDKLLSIEEVKQTATLQCSATMDSLDSTQSQLADLNDEVTRLNYSLEEEKRKRRLAEERYTTQQEEYELVLRKRQKELDTVSWSKVEIEKSVTNKDHEIEQLRRQLAEEAARIRELQKEMSKVRSQCSMEINNLKLSYESQIHVSCTDMQRLAAQREEDTVDVQLRYDRMEAERRNLEEELRKLRMSLSQAEEQRNRAEEEAHSQRAVITEEGCRRRELESQVEVLIRQRDEEHSQYAEELAEVMKRLQEKSDELAYITHSLEEETRRRRTIEEGQDVLEQTLAQLQVKLTSSSVAATQLGECEEELQKISMELERESRERSRVEQNMSRLQSRMKDLQDVRGGLESQVENLRRANQEEVSRRRQVETELENTTKAMTEYISTVTTLSQSQEHASMSEKRGEEERLRLQEELERSSRQNKTSAERMTQLSAKLKALQQQLLQEQAGGKEANLRNEGLYRTIEEKSKALNERSGELQRLKEMTESQTKERLRLEEELTAARHDKAELLRSKQGSDDELSSQITALQLQLQASERSNVDYRNLASELSSEREKLKLETEKIQKQATETTTMMQSIQSQYSEIVNERDALLLRLQLSDKDKDRYQRLEDELSRIKLSQDSELRSKQRIQDENERAKRDSDYWKDQFDSKQVLIRQYETDKERLEREKNSLKSELERLMRDLRELDETYKIRLSDMQKELREVAVVRKTMETELMRVREPPTLDPSTLVFDGVRKPVTANQLVDCGVLDKPTLSQLVKGHKTVPDVSVDKKVSLKGTGPIAGVVIQGPKGPGSFTGPLCKMTFTEAKKENLLPPDSVDLLLDAQAATGHIIDPRTNRKLTVEEACDQGVVDEEDRERLLAAEAAAVGYYGPGTNKPLSVFQAMTKGLIDKNTTLRLLQAQESVGGILDPILSVFLPKDTAIERNLINDDIYYALSQRPELYLDPESEDGVTYMSMKRRCKVEPHTGLLLLPIPEKVDPSKLVFDGVRKPVTAEQLLDCGVLDKPTFKDLEKGKKNVPEVSVDKHVNLKGTGPIAGVVVGREGKMSLSEAKKRMLLPPDSADLLLEAQAATGHIIDPRNNQKLTVDEACDRGVVDIKDRDRLLEAEAAAVGYKDFSAAKPLSVFEAMKKELIDRKTGLRLLQAQESVGGILDPNLSVFLPKDTAIKRNLLDENLRQALNHSPECYRDPETERDASYGALKKRCKTEPHTGLLLLPITEKLDPSKLIFDGVRKPVTAQQLLDCGVLDKPTFNQLMKGEKTVPQVSVDKKVFLKGTGSISGVAAGPLGKMSFSEAKKQMLMPAESADLLLDAQAATGHIIDPTTNQKLTVEEACARRVVENRDRDRLLAAEAAAVGYRDPSTAKPLSVFEAMKKGLIDRKTGLRLLQAQESAGGILDPNLSVFLPKDTAIKRNLLDEDLRQALNQSPGCYIDPDTERDTSYGALKKRSKTESHTGLILLPINERKDPSKLIFDGVRKPVTAQQLFECGVLDKPTFDQLVKGEKTVPAVSTEKTVYLKGTGPIAGVVVGREGKMSFSEAKKRMLLPPDSADLLLEAQAATGHILDPEANQKLTVEDACARGVVDIRDRDRLLAAEAAAIGFKDPSGAKPLSVFEAMKKGLIERKTGLRLLQAQESVGGILDPNLSVFLPKDTAIKRNLLDEELCHALNQSPECYVDPDTERETSYGTLKRRSKTESHTGLILLPIPEKVDPSKLVFDGVRKPVTAKQLLDCGVLDKPTFKDLEKGKKNVPEVSVDKNVNLKGTGPIAGVVAGSQGKMSLSEAKKKALLPEDIADLLLEAQAATGHIIDPKNNQKLTVDEACARGVVDIKDRDRLLEAEAAAVGYKDFSAAKPLSVFEAMKKELIDRKTGLRLLQAQESVGGILDPNLSVFLPKDTAIKRNLLDENLRQALNQSPECYRDPETERDASYGALKKKCKTEPHTGLLLLPITEKLDPSKLIFDGVRKPVTAQQLLDCGVLDKPTFNQLMKGEKTVPQVSVDKKVFLKGTGSISGVAAGPLGKMSLSEAKKQMLMPAESADLLLDAQAATGHIIDPTTNQKLTVEEACARRVVENRDRDRLLAAEAAAVGYRDPSTAKPLSVFEAMKKGLIDRKTGLRLLQAQESAGGILDPNLSVFLPKDTAIKRNLLDEDLRQALNQSPGCYIDPDTERDTSYGALKKRSKTESHTGLILLPINERKDPSKLIFDGVRKPVTAQQLFECGVLDKPTFDQLVKGEKTVPAVSTEKTVYLKGTGPIAGVVVGREGKMSFSEAKKRMLLPPDSADLLLEAQAATGHILDPEANQKLTVEDACARGVVDIRDRDRLLAAEAAAVGFKDPSGAKPLSVFEAMKKGLIDRKTGLRLLQAQESMGGILDPNLSVFLPKDTAVKRNLLDEELCHALNQSPECYVDPDTERDTSYGTLKRRSKTESHTGLILLPITEKKDPSKLMFDGIRKPVSAQQLFECGVLDKPTFEDLEKGKKNVPEVSVDKNVNLKGTGPIAGVVAGSQGKMSLSEAKKKAILPEDIADLLLEAQAATGHIIDPRNNQKLTVDEACDRGVVDIKDRDRLLEAEAAAVGYKDFSAAKPLSVFEAMKKELIDRKTGLRLLQAQESVGGILDPNLSVFLPKDTAIKRNLLDENLRQALNQSPECYRDPETERDASYGALKKRCKTEPHTGLLLLPITEKLDPSKLIFDGVRKPVTAQQLLDCGVLDKPTFNQLMNGEKTVPQVSVDKKVFLKGTGSISGVAAGPLGKMSLSEAKKQMLMPAESADLLLDAQAATGHIIDPTTNQKLTVEEACARRVVENRDRDRLLAAEAAAVGYRDPSTAKPLSVFEAMKKGLIDRKTGLRLLQAQESAGGILDPNLSVFLPKDTAIKRNLLDEDLRQALNQSPGCYIDPDTERDTSYGALKKRSKTESHAGLILLPINERKDPSKLIFDGVRKPVTAQQLFECGVLDKPTFDQLVKGEKTVPAVSTEKTVYLKGTGPIAGVVVGREGKMSFSEAKKRMLLPPDSADLLLEAQAATGHILDPEANQKLTVEDACARGVVDISDRDRLLAAEAAAVGFKDPSGAKPLSVFEAMKKGLIERKTGLRLLQAQESVGGILDPNLSVFLPKDTAVKRNLLDEELCHALNQSPECYVDPDTERDTSYGTLKRRSKTESHTGLILLPITEKKDPSKLMFDGIRKPVSALQLFECGVLDKPTLNQLVKGEKTVPAVSMEKMVYLQGTGPIAGVVAGREGKMSFSEAKKQMLLPSDSAYLLLEAQAATGHIIDPKTNQKLTVEEACARGVVDIRDRDRLLVAEAAAVGFKDPRGAKPLSVFEAMKKGLIDRKTVLRLLQAQESVGGIVDPNLSVFLPKDTAIKRNLLDEDLRQALNQGPECYVDPETENDASYGALQEKCKTEPQASLKLLPVSEKKDPSKLLFDGVRKTVTAQQLLDCGVLDKPTFNKLMKGEKTVPDVSVDKKVFLKGTGSIAGVAAGPLGKMSFTEAKKQKIMSSDSADMLLEAQAATGNIIDPRTNERLTVKAACAKGVVDKEDESKLFAAEAAAIGYRDPNTGKLLSAGQAMKKGLIDKDTALRILQAQESVGGILDPALSVFLPKDIAKDRDLIDEDLYRGLNQYPECYLDPDTQQATTYVSLKKKCKADPKTGLLLLPEPKKPITVQGLRGQVPVRDLVDANLLDRSDMDQLREGRLTSQDIEDRLHSYLRGSTCIAGVYDEASDKVMPIYQAMKDGLLQSGTTLELLEAQAASGFIVDPVNNHYLTVSDAYNKRLFGPEFKDNLLSAERAVTGYKLPGTDKIISLFQAIERGLVEKGHGIRLLEAQIASGGIIDPEHSHRIDVNVAYKRGYFDEEMNKALTDQNVDTKGFFDPNTEENLAYLELKNRCITDKKTGLILLPITDKKSQESTSKNTLRKRRVVIVDPETNKEMTVRVAYDKGYIDYDTFVELSEQECEWEEITITAPDGSVRFVIIDRKTGRQYDISELLEMRVINQSDVDNYRSRTITLTQFADIISNKTKYGSSSSSASRSSAAGGTSSVTSSTSRTSASPGTFSVTSSSTSRTSASPGTSSVTSSSTLRTSAASVPSSVTSSLSSSVLSRPLSPSLSKMTKTRTSTVTERSTSTCSVPRDSTDSRRNISSISVTLSSPIEVIDEQEPVGAVFDTDCIEKISITEALDRGLVDSITAQRLLEAQACTGGIINPTNGHRLSIHEATRLGIISDNMGPKLKPAQKAFFGFEDVKNKKKLSVPQAMKERWLPYEAGQRFLEFQYVTGGIYDPEMCCRRTIDEAVEMKWLDSRDAERLQNVRDHTKNLTCPKSKLRISYKQALDNCLVEESNGLKMLQASSVSSRGISSPYNVSSAPGSTTGSRSGSRRSSRRSSVDLGSPSSSGTYHHSVSSFTTYSASSK
ncbi:uncharacterized protein LOC141768198 isoform X1 [Sebastes fasciatus]|uniref:uncharacterized protein LOC141768198 isoform X1 n=1 Tax=Sebastes fasciatus TaxID=394691 RepID=UPI003D9F6B76